MLAGKDKMQDLLEFFCIFIAIALGQTDTCPHTCSILISGSGVLRGEIGAILKSCTGKSLRRTDGGYF
jgi:hypothetical protein